MVHVNNAVYADWLDEAVLAAGGSDVVRAIPRLARLEYVRATEPDERLEIAVWRDAGGWSCRVAGADGPDKADRTDRPDRTDKNDRLRARLEPLAEA
jgi:acyl-ACP thioesterase